MLITSLRIQRFIAIRLADQR